MLKSILLSSVLLCAVPVMAHAVEPAAETSSATTISDADNQAIDAKANAFFTDLNAGHTDTAYYNAFVPRMATENKQALQGLISQTQTALAFAGLPVKWEKMSQTELASVMVARTYIVYSKDLPARFKFTFFKTPQGWYVQSVFFNDFNAQEY